MNKLLEFEELRPVVEQADHIDTKSVISTRSMAAIVNGMFSYEPGWVRLLFAARGVLAGFLGLDHPEKPPKCDTEQLPMKKGETFTPMGPGWSVFAVESGRMWSTLYEDTHLDAWVVCLREDLGERGARYEVSTVVKYKNPTGKFYFTLICPFHHLIVRAALNKAS